MTTAVTKQDERQVARPLNVLVPLIKKDLEEAHEASERAGMPYYQAAGEKMLEAKEHFNKGQADEFYGWVERNFHVKERQAQYYMKLVVTLETKRAGARPESLTDFRRQTQPNYNRPAAWHEPVKETLDRVNTEKLNRHASEVSRIDELNAQRALALQLIDIGYKALATKLHPDKGGSRDAMARLNNVRRCLKEFADNPTKFR